MAGKKIDHGVETAALAAVVRSVIDELTTRHAKVFPQAALDGFGSIERFVAGQSVSFETLDEARKVYDLKQPDRALQWAQTAIGNLGFYATKVRGWKVADASVMDAACYALSSARKDQSAPHEELAQLRAQALASAQTRQGPALKVKGRPKLRRVKDELAAHLGAKANQRLLKRKGVFDSKARGDEASLRALLVQRGLPESAAVLAFDARYGGLIFNDDDAGEGGDWLVGAHACLASDAHTVEKGERVPVAYAPNDVIFYLDCDGIAYVWDSIEGGDAARFASTGDEMLQLILLRADD